VSGLCGTAPVFEGVRCYPPPHEDTDLPTADGLLVIVGVAQTGRPRRASFRLVSRSRDKGGMTAAAEPAERRTLAKEFRANGPVSEIRPHPKNARDQDRASLRE
jgi:hypothetical protein